MTIYATFDAQGFVSGFWDSNFVSDKQSIPKEAIEISDDDRRKLLEAPSTRKWKDGEVVECGMVPGQPAIEEYRLAIQGFIDRKAKEKQYDNGATFASYVNSTVAQWASDAKAFVKWRDDVWQYSFSELDKVKSGLRSQPTVEDFLKELPELEWADV